MTKHRTDFLCPRCGVNPRPARPDGRLRGWCMSCEAAAKKPYNNSSVGKANKKRYHDKIKQEEQDRDTRTGSSWSEEEVASLVELYSSGMKIRSIASELSRSYFAVKDRLTKLFRAGFRYR